MIERPMNFCLNSQSAIQIKVEKIGGRSHLVCPVCRRTSINFTEFTNSHVYQRPEPELVLSVCNFGRNIPMPR